MKLFILLFSFISVCSYAADEHVIDLEMNNCLNTEANQTSSGMNDCVFIATEAWSAELNKIYNQLINELTEDGSKKLKVSQQQWIVHRDLEFMFLKAMYNRKEFSGSIYSNIHNMDVLNIVKNRALVLARYTKRHKI